MYADGLFVTLLISVKVKSSAEVTPDNLQIVCIHLFFRRLGKIQGKEIISPSLFTSMNITANTWLNLR